MKERFQQFMIGRYGLDELGRYLNIVACIVFLLGLIITPQASSLGIVLIIYNYFRIFSRNIRARSNENAAFLRVRSQFGRWLSSKKLRFSQRNTHCFYKCPSCKKTIRVPKGKGKIEITCPACRNRFVKRS